MAFPTSAGFRDLAAASIGYIPEVWSGKLLVKFYDASVLAAIANTDYEGEITGYGNKVNIRTTPDITVRDYTKGQQLVHQQPESNEVELNIDRGKYWAFEDDDVDQIQTDLKNYVENWTDDASEQLKISIDTQVLANIFTDVAAANTGTSAGRISGNINLGATGAALGVDQVNITDVLVDCGTVLDEQNVPESGRWVVLPAAITALIKKSDLKDASLAGDGTSILRNGRVGMVDRFMVYSSNLLTSVADTDSGGNPVTAFESLFGTRHALTFATQLVKNESLPNPFGFGTLYRGLQVYGFRVIKTDAMGRLHIFKA